MDLNAIDPRASSPTADSRKSKSSNGDAFQGVMQMMAKIDEHRSENQARDRTDPTRPEKSDKSDKSEREPHVERKDKAPREDEAAGTKKAAPEHDNSVTEEQAVAPSLVDMTAPPPVQTGGTEQAVASGTADGAKVDATAGTTGQPTETAASGTQTVEPGTMQGPAAAAVAPAAATPTPDRSGSAAAQPAVQPAQAPAQAQAQVPASAPSKAQTPVETKAGDLSALARQAAGQRDRIDPAASSTGTQKAGDAQSAGEASKPSTASGRTDSLIGAKVTVETPVPVARSQGVSSAVLVQAQQAAAGGQVQASNANGGAGTLHVGGNQPTFVGADGSATNSSTGQGANGNNAGGQNGGANNQSQNQGQGGQPNPQQVGVSFGATIGQRGFGGDASRAQFQEILATRTARAQPVSLAGGEAGRPTGVSSSSTPMSMAGVGGPQSTHTSASPADRAAATAHGRPGANLGTPADQVAMKMSASAKDGGGKVTIRLSPEELGKVDIRMEISKDGLVRAVVAVDRPETLELLQRDAKGLERVLQDAGLQTDGDSLEFDLRGGNDQADDADDGAGGNGPADGELASQNIDGDGVAADQQGDEGSGGVKADGSLDLVA